MLTCLLQVTSFNMNNDKMEHKKMFESEIIFVYEN